MINRNFSQKGPAESLFEHMLGLYPPHFRREFSDEIYSVFLRRVDDAKAQGGMVWPAAILQELTALALSILKERWHEGWIRKGESMATEDQVTENSAGGGAVLQRAGLPGSGPLWVAGWVLLTIGILPMAIFLASPLAIPYMWLLNLGARAGLWPASYSSMTEILGLTTGLAIGIAAVQWLMLRHVLPKPGLWFAATALGIWFAGWGIWGSIQATLGNSMDSYWATRFMLLFTGLVLGVAQWLYARRYFRNGGRIILIDLSAAASLWLLPRVFTQPSDAVWLVVLALPGLMTGAGMWLLLSQPKYDSVLYIKAKTARARVWLRRMIWIVIALAALVPLYFVGIYAYAASRIALARNQGVYPTAEVALIATYSQSSGGANVVSVENVRTGPNFHDGRMPFLWFGTATVKFDRIPRGYDKASFGGGSYIMHVRDGWVFMPEGCFPEFVGWVMELYHLEGVP